jgi:hypothetical protein
MENQINITHNTSKVKTILGIAFVALGVSILLHRFSFIMFPHLVISWPIMMIALGIYIGAKSDFKKTNWIYLTAFGFLFLLANIIPSFTFGLLWPISIMAIGAFVYSRRNQKWNGERWEKPANN